MSMVQSDKYASLDILREIFLPSFALDSPHYWAGRTPRPNNGPPNMAAANFVVIPNGEGCALNGTAVAAVFIDQ